MSKLYTLRREQTLPVSKTKLWDFIASPKNLEKITPPYMRFEVLNQPEERIYAGQIISYYVRPLLNIKMNWITEITHVDVGHYFVDEQRFGPYALWHHLHRLDETNDGVKMTDVVHYKLPFGVFGDWTNALVVERRVEEIFDFRFKKMEELFGKAKS